MGPCNSAYEVFVSLYAKDIAGSFRLERIIIKRTDTNLFLYLSTDGMKDYDIKICATSRARKRN
jgi:hypothetical protein